MWLMFDFFEWVYITSGNLICKSLNLNMAELKIYLDEKHNPKVLKALVAVIEAFDLDYKIEEDNVLNDEQKQEILRREKKYKYGKMKLNTIEEVKKHLK
ncbi:hypothetical protein BDD43_1471 [Mucilaginibacter gracilis]|uniref:Uncharacterized protein n=2 Tax=Mucilaginibacter gracilis TaxID=423350 RepID=A0A495IXA7_9SPHI|nr:hypothetical protein BDD43_1471 [Mucilaginibacter gracilis]